MLATFLDTGAQKRGKGYKAQSKCDSREKENWNVMVRVQETRGEKEQAGLLETVGKSVLIKINKLQQLRGVWV